MCGWFGSNGKSCRTEAEYGAPKRPALMIRDKQQPLVAYTPPEHAFPFDSMQGFHVAMERVGFHLGEYECHALLNGFGESAKVPLCVFG